MNKFTTNLFKTNRISGAELFRTFIFVFVILINVAMGFLKLFFFKFFNDCQICFSVWQVDTEFFDRKKRDGYICQRDNVQIPKSIQSFSNLASIINNAAMKETKSSLLHFEFQKLSFLYWKGARNADVHDMAVDKTRF